MPELEIEAVCHPDFDLPSLQTIVLSGRAGDGRVLSTLTAARYAEPGFHPGEAYELVSAFDDHTALAYGLAIEVEQRRLAMMRRYRDVDPCACGFIGILSIYTVADAAGERSGLALIRFLQRLHAGMGWYAGLQAAPQKLEPGTADYRAMKKRLVSYYASDPVLGFREDTPRSSPGLMTAYWSGE